MIYLQTIPIGGAKWIAHYDNLHARDRLARLGDGDGEDRLVTGVQSPVGAGKPDGDLPRRDHSKPPSRAHRSSGCLMKARSAALPPPINGSP